MIETIEIRKAHMPNDIRVLNRLERVSFPQDTDPAYREDWKNYQNYIVYADGRPVGFAGLQPNTGLYSYKTDSHKPRLGALHFTILGVVPRLRNRGIGELLMSFVSCYARLSGFASINATTRASNKPMQALFKKCGYSVTKRIRAFYPDGETAFVEELFWKKKKIIRKASIR